MQHSADDARSPLSQWRIAIVGTGLVGGSIALALRERAPHTRVTALDRGDDLRAVADADLIVLCAPILQNHDLLGALRTILAPDTLITDTGSTKSATVEAARGLRFIGGHPIAGGTGTGRSHARADLFAGRPWVLTPAGSTDERDLQHLRSFVETLGAAAVIMDPGEHDRLFAHLSHLPQLVISALADAVGEHAGRDGLALAGAGLRDSTRLASSSAAIWQDVLATNRMHIRTALDALIGRLERLRDDPDGAAARQIFESANRVRTLLEPRQP